MLYTRFISVVVFTFTLFLEIFVFLYLMKNKEHVFRSIAVMVYCIGFWVYGSIINSNSLSRSVTLYIFTIISLIPAAFSPLYCETCSLVSTFSYFEYRFLAIALPYSTIFWLSIRSISKRHPFYRANLLILLLIFLHTPLILLMMNSL